MGDGWAEIGRWCATGVWMVGGRSLTVAVLYVVPNRCWRTVRRYPRRPTRRSAATRAGGYTHAQKQTCACHPTLLEDMQAWRSTAIAMPPGHPTALSVPHADPP